MYMTKRLIVLYGGSGQVMKKNRLKTHLVIQQIGDINLMFLNQVFLVQD